MLQVIQKIGCCIYLPYPDLTILTSTISNFPCIYTGLIFENDGITMGGGGGGGGYWTMAEGPDTFFYITVC